MPPNQLQSLRKYVVVSYDSLRRYLPDFEVPQESITLPQSRRLSVEVRIAVFTTQSDRPVQYFAVFAFDREKKNRLVLLSMPMIEEICEYLTSNRLAGSEDVLLIIGKQGSKMSNQMNLLFLRSIFKKVLTIDFDVKQSLVDFLREIAGDIDRIETRKRSLSDPVRTDLTSLPVSEKRIRESSDQRRHITVFANQLLQINGITETSAVTIAEKYEYPRSLMHTIAQGDNLDILVLNPRGDARKLNNRVKSALCKIFSFTVDSVDTIK